MAGEVHPSARVKHSLPSVRWHPQPAPGGRPCPKRWGAVPRGAGFSAAQPLFPLARDGTRQGGRAGYCLDVSPGILGTREDVARARSQPGGVGTPQQTLSPAPLPRSSPSCRVWKQGNRLLAHETCQHWTCSWSPARFGQPFGSHPSPQPAAVTQRLGFPPRPGGSRSSREGPGGRLHHGHACPAFPSARLAPGGLVLPAWHRDTEPRCGAAPGTGQCPSRAWGRHRAALYRVDGCCNFVISRWILGCIFNEHKGFYLAGVSGFRKDPVWYLMSGDRVRAEVLVRAYLCFPKPGQTQQPSQTCPDTPGGKGNGILVPGCALLSSPVSLLIMELTRKPGFEK